MSVLYPIANCHREDRRADVVFVHGLGGHAFATWRHGKDEQTSWPHWLGDDAPNVGVWSLGYAASPSRWAVVFRCFGFNDQASGYSMPLPDRALQVLDLMVLRGFGERPIMFVGHSLGGLVIKQLLRTAADEKLDSRKRELFRKTRAVLFLGTPHAGSELATLGNAFRAIFGATVSLEDLRAHDAHLRNLFNWFRNHASLMRTCTYFETRAIAGFTIVNPTSAHPGVGEDPVGLDEDHLSLAKPRHRQAHVCAAALDLVHDVVGAPYVPSTVHDDLLWYVVFTGHIKDYDRPKVEALLRRIREVASDANVEFVKLDEGSVRVVVRGSRAGFERLMKAKADGVVSDLLGVEVIEVGRAEPRDAEADGVVLSPSEVANQALKRPYIVEHSANRANAQGRVVFDGFAANPLGPPAAALPAGSAAISAAVRPARSSAHVGGAYAWYVLAVLTFVYAFSIIDRQILTILAPFIAADLGFTDAQIGLLYGTAFALFYVLFGIPLGRLADTWIRTRMIAIGLAVKSMMTALSGFANNFAQLGAARVGVGVGEASASPAAYSLLSDWFPREKRATALAIYSSGIYIGAGVSLVIGGWVVANWSRAFAGGIAPLGLEGWQAAFLAVGLPGLLLAVLVATLREPQRGQVDGTAQPNDPHPFAKSWLEFAAVVAPFTFMHLRKLQASAAEWRRNLIAFGVAIASAALVTRLTDGLLSANRRAPIASLGDLQITSNTVQWSAFAFAGYGLFTWAQSLKLRDRPTYTLIWRTPTFLYATVASGLFACGLYGVGAFQVVYAHRVLGAEPTSAGIVLGLSYAVAGWVGTAAGGVLGDALRRRYASGRIILSLATVVVSVPIGVYAFATSNVTAFYVASAAFFLIGTAWHAGCATTCQDLVLPRMRGTATVTFLLGQAMIGLVLGPYCVGLISDIFGDLRIGILSVFLLAPITCFCLYRAIRGLPEAETSVLERARREGEALPGALERQLESSSPEHAARVRGTRPS
jgi:MFS family permease